MNWNNDIDNNGFDCIYIEIEADGFTYELGVFCNSSEYCWQLETTEMFGECSFYATHSMLASGYVATIEDGKNAAINAYRNRQRLRMEIIENLF